MSSEHQHDQSKESSETNPNLSGTIDKINDHCYRVTVGDGTESNLTFRFTNISDGKCRLEVTPYLGCEKTKYIRLQTDLTPADAAPEIIQLVDDDAEVYSGDYHLMIQLPDGDSMADLIGVDVSNPLPYLEIRQSADESFGEAFAGFVLNQEPRLESPNMPENTVRPVHAIGSDERIIGTINKVGSHFYHIIVGDGSYANLIFEFGHLGTKGRSSSVLRLWEYSQQIEPETISLDLDPLPDERWPEIIQREDHELMIRVPDGDSMTDLVAVDLSGDMPHIDVRKSADGTFGEAFAGYVINEK